MQYGDGRGVVVVVDDAHHLVSIVGAGKEVGDDGSGARDLYLLPLFGGRTGIVEAEVVDIETVLVGAVEVADGDVALLAAILAQVDGVFDSTVEKGKKSRFAGYKLRFTDIPSDAADPSQWEVKIANDGTATLTFTLYALVKNKIKCSFTMVDYRGVDVKTYFYNIINKWGKLTHKQDLATGGDEVEAPELKDLELDYNPMTVNNNITMYGTWFTGTPDEMYEERPLFDIEQLRSITIRVSRSL